MYSLFISTPLLALAFLPFCSAQEQCPEIPENDVEMGQPVPVVPSDIPKGCSDFEILVGKFYVDILASASSLFVCVCV